MNVHTKWSCLIPSLPRLVKYYLFQGGIHHKNYNLRVVTQGSWFTELVSTMNRIHRHTTILHPPHNS